MSRKFPTVVSRRDLGYVPPFVSSVCGSATVWTRSLPSHHVTLTTVLPQSMLELVIRGELHDLLTKIATKHMVSDTLKYYLVDDIINVRPSFSFSYVAIFLPLAYPWNGWFISLFFFFSVKTVMYSFNLLFFEGEGRCCVYYPQKLLSLKIFLRWSTSAGKSPSSSPVLLSPDRLNMTLP